ncbi:MAG: beta-lactamase family protein, partial [Gemmatimonadota bacterium]
MDARTSNKVLKSCVRRLVLAGLAIPIACAVTLAQDRASQIDSLAQQYHDLRLFNGAVLVAEDGDVIYKKGFGYANLEWGIPNQTNTKFRIGSVTKQFTAVIVLQLVEEGVLSLDGKIVDYLPDYPRPAGEQITIHHLLTHSSGIPNYTSLPDFFPEMSRDPYEPLEFLAVFSGLELEFEPGAKWSYSNSGYFLLGAIIEAVTGKPYDRVLRERLLRPLGLDDTGYDHYEEIIERRAAGYETTFTGYENAAYLDTALPYAAGSLYSTVEDLQKWDRALYSDALFSDQHYRELMFTPHIGDYGYGFFIRKVPVGGAGDSVKVIEHGGGINGFITGVRRFVDGGHLIVLMDNTSSSVAG